MTDVGPSTRPAHFNHAGASIPPTSVVDRVVEHLRLEARIGGYEAAEVVAAEAALVPSALGALIGAAPGEVVAVESATRAWELILWALAHSHRWGPDDRVVVDQFAYASSWATLQRLRAVTGVEVAVAPALDDGSIDPERLGEAVDDRTRLLLATHVPTHIGTVSDVAGVGAAVAGRELVYAVDVSQSLGQMALDVSNIGCQVAFAPGRKFLRAPRGTGLLYVADAVAGSVSPLGIDLTSTTSLDIASFDLQPGARRFETFEHSLALRLGMAEAARHALALGWTDIEKGVAERTAQVVELVEGHTRSRAAGPAAAVGDRVLHPRHAGPRRGPRPPGHPGRQRLGGGGGRQPG